MNKKDLTERDICSKFITPSLMKAWRSQDQIREEVYFTKWKIKVKWKIIARWEPRRADYILYYKNNFPIAVIEAKDNKHSIGDGMQQWLWYADTLDIPFVFSSNGDWFLEHDRTKSEWTIETNITLDNFPTPEELYKRYQVWKWFDDSNEKLISHPYYDDWSWKQPRYYQEVAINRTIEAIAKWQDRMMLVMATWTGKTYTAFQIIRRLWKSWTKKRILFLADRNILIDQTMIDDFKPFGGAMTKIQNRKVDKSYEIYLALYQWLTGTEEFNNIYQEFSPDFFDLIIIDECHRWSARENSSWRKILDHFGWATHIGLTATPKETEDVSSSNYFGDALYTYSLKQGIDDGFLAPYKVIKVGLNIDDERRPYKGQLDFYGNEIPDRIYNVKDFDRNIIIKERTEEVARKLTEFLKATDRMSKTIVFCVDIDHAERMRQALVNQNADEVAKNRKYVMRITWDEKEWKANLGNFIDPKEPYPVIVTTSKLLTTGVNAQTCKVIVLDAVINSMTEFKQIIWRGTRIKEDYGKYYFTIMDFRKATNKFADSEFDGNPVVVYNPAPDEEVDPNSIIAGETYEDEIEETDTQINLAEDEKEGRKKIFVQWVSVEVMQERVQYIGTDGKLITESLKDYTKKNVLDEYHSLDEFLTAWQDADKKQVIISEMEEKGILFEELQQQSDKDLDPFDLICHIAFDKPPLTRQERVKNVQKRDIFAKYWEEAKEIIEMLLMKYADQGIESIEDINILNVSPFTQVWTPYEIVSNIFGSKENYLIMVRELEGCIYN